MVCISCISNVNQLGSHSHCDVMAGHLHGNREDFFLCNLWILKCQFLPSQMLEINRGSQQKALLCTKSESHVCHLPSGSV